MIPGCSAVLLTPALPTLYDTELAVRYWSLLEKESLISFRNALRRAIW